MGFGSTTEDIDGVPKNIDRGPPEEKRMTEEELRGAMREFASVKMTRAEQLTLKGVQEEMKVLRALVDDAINQNNHLVNLYTTLQTEFEQYRKQRSIELQSWLATGGSTTPEDN